MPLDPTIARELRIAIDKYTADGTLRPKSELDRYYATFRARFGPEVLRSLDGPALLETLHYTSNPSSLVYWLEFKNDDEMPAIFGSIAGGSALKFGLYRRRDTGAWMTGSSSAQRELTTDEAIVMARKQRDQFVAGAAVLDALSANPERVDYDGLQTKMQSAAPDVASRVWGHKYFSMLAPTVLDHYHMLHYQQFYLLKMLMSPPKRKGSYIAAEGFLTAAREVGISVANLGTLLNKTHGEPHRRWRISTKGDESPESQWPMMRSKGRVAIGWRKLGDLSALENSSQGVEGLRNKLRTLYGTSVPKHQPVAVRIKCFVREVSKGDVVVACDDGTVLAVGRVTSEYAFDQSETLPHFHEVDWLDTSTWSLPVTDDLRSPPNEFKNSSENVLAIERHLAALRAPGAARPDNAKPLPEVLSALAPTTLRIHEILERKGQVILYGPPGTGKTHHAEAATRELVARAWFSKDFAKLVEEERRTVVGTSTEPGVIETCCFHPAYGYEDFIEGYRPQSSVGALGFTLRDGVFKRLCRRAEATPTKPFYLIIDEINRGDIPRIFGELLMVLEKGRRGSSVRLPVSGERFVVPPNVFVIGTMNTADRSIALLDTALRRRFGFVELMPDASVLCDAVVQGVPLGPWLDALNARIVLHAGRDARNLQVGHSYLLHGQRPLSDLGHFAQVLRDDIIPLLEEYCYEDYAALERILGSTLVLRDRQRIDHTLFADGRRDDLVRALLEPCPEITASPQAIAQGGQQDESAADDDNGEGDT